MVAPESRWSSMLLASLMGPVSQLPDGTSTTPPPAATAAATAFLKAVVFFVVPLPTPPKLVTLKMLQGMVGGVNVTLPHGAATVMADWFRHEQVPVTAALTATTSPGSGAGSPPQWNRNNDPQIPRTCAQLFVPFFILPPVVPT